jgi:DNA gyrase/topoisomerase IV subunit A
MSTTIKPSSNYLLDTSREYSIYVCGNRAIPSVSDGLKNGQRQAMWVIRNKTDKIKVIALAGALIESELYLHGDKSAADAISKLAAPYCNNIPYLDGKGTFGTRVAPVEGIGAPRYVSVKKGKAAENLIYPDLDIVPLKDNHDGSTKEPITFLPVIPTVLLNGISGIAVGWSTEILPHSLDSIIKATVAALEGKKIPKLIPSYDYFDITVKPSPGNPNSWEFTGKIDIKDSSTARVTELPPDLTLVTFRERLVAMAEEGIIVDFTDKSTKTINVEIKFKRGILRENYTVEKLIDLFKLTTKKKERIVVIDWDGKSIRTYPNPEDVVKDFVEWRFKRYIERYEKSRDDTNTELNFWKGVKLCYDDNLPDRIMKLADKKEVEGEISRITAKIKLTDAQIDRITNFASYRWAKDGYQQCKDKIAELNIQYKEYVRLLANPDEIKTIFKNEVVALGKIKFK